MYVPVTCRSQGAVWQVVVPWPEITMLGRSATPANAILIEDPEVAMDHLRAFLQLGEAENHPAADAFNRAGGKSQHAFRESLIFCIPHIKDT